MSDPVTNVEIEDVLSSIRRLVSEDTRPRKVPERSNRLVLTPAQRVVDEPHAEDIPEDIPTEAEKALDEVLSLTETDGPVLLTNPDLPSTEAEAQDAAPLEAEQPLELVSEVVDEVPLETGLPDESDWDEIEESEVGEQTEEELAELSPKHVSEVGGLTSDDDIPTVEADLPMSATAVLSQLIELEVARAFSDGPTDTDLEDVSEQAEAAMISLDDSSTSESLDLDLDQEDETPQGDSTEIADEPEGHEFAAVEPDELTVDPWQGASPWDDADVDDAARDAEEEFAAALERSEPVAEVDEAADSAPMGDTLESKIAALEQMVGFQSAEPEPEVQPDTSDATFVHRPISPLEWEDTAAETSEAWADESAMFTTNRIVEERHESAPSAVTEVVEADPVVAAPAPEAAIATIDEEDLRDMVSEIVRQELQGALGERITRNVRKLVRREIHRVLQSQDFE